MTNATITRTVTADFPDYPSVSVVFTLMSSIAIASPEIFPGLKYTMSLDADGLGSIALPVPDNTGTAAWLWQAVLPDGRDPYFTLAYDASSVTLATLLVAEIAESDPNDLQVLLDAYQLRDTDAVTDNIAKMDATGTSVDSTYGFADVVLSDARIISKNATYEVAAGDAAKIIECDGTFTVTFPDSLDAGFQVVIVNVGSGTITLAAATTLQGKGTQLTAQYGAATAYHRGSDVWLAFGDLS